MIEMVINIDNCVHIIVCEDDRGGSMYFSKGGSEFGKGGGDTSRIFDAK